MHVHGNGHVAWVRMCGKWQAMTYMSLIALAAERGRIAKLASGYKRMPRV